MRLILPLVVAIAVIGGGVRAQNAPVSEKGPNFPTSHHGPTYPAGPSKQKPAPSFSGSHAQPRDNWVQDYAVQLLWGDEQNPGYAGVYLGNGLIITAAHVAGANTRGVRIHGLNLPAKLVKTGSPSLDLSLISIDQGKIPDSLRERRMPLCQEQPTAGAPVILAALQGITRTSIASPTLIAPEYRTKFPTLISEGSTDGKSGSGVFDAERKCLLGILTLKITNNIDHKDIASYFVPASTIKSFIPVEIQR